MRRPIALAVAATVCGLLLPATAGAQDVGPIAEDLRKHDVTFEEGALTSAELAKLDQVTTEMQGQGGYFKIVVLEDDVSSYSSTGEFADRVRQSLGSQGRVLVYSPQQVALASDVDDSSAMGRAEQAAADAINGDKSLAAATVDAGGELGINTSGIDVKDSGGGGGGFPWGALLLLLALPLGLLALLWWSARKMRNRMEATSAEEVGAAEVKVRAAVDEVANDVLDLSDRIDQPDTPAEARTAFASGAELFTTTQQMLETADTRSELEEAYPKVVEAGWQLDIARALMDGEAAPPKPDPEPLFPKRMLPSQPAVQPGVESAPAPQPAAATPEPHYRKSNASPWITAAATAAMAVLSRRGMSVPQTRPAMDESGFGSWTSGLPRPQTKRSSSRGWSRRGGTVQPSGRIRGRGVGRR